MSRLIDADALTERLNEYANDDWNVSLGEVFTDAVDTCLDFVENAPTIEAVPVVHGEWENVGDNEEDLCFRCTNCNTEFSCEINMRQFAKHCPNCGADMLKGGVD